MLLLVFDDTVTIPHTRPVAEGVGSSCLLFRSCSPLLAHRRTSICVVGLHLRNEVLVPFFFSFFFSDTFFFFFFSTFSFPCSRRFLPPLPSGGAMARGVATPLTATPLHSQGWLVCLSYARLALTRSRIAHIYSRTDGVVLMMTQNVYVEVPKRY